MHTQKANEYDTNKNPQWEMTIKKKNKKKKIIQRQQQHNRQRETTTYMPIHTPTACSILKQRTGIPVLCIHDVVCYININ